MALFRVPVLLSFASGGGPGVNVWSVRTTGQPADTDDNQLAAAVDEIRQFYLYLAANGTTPASIFAPAMVITLGEVVDRASSEAHNPAFAQITTPVIGTTAPPALQMVVGWRTTLRARRGMGRTFLGPLNSACIESNGTPVPGVKTVIDQAAQALLDASQDDLGWSIGVYGQESKLPAGATPADRRLAPHVHRDITSHSVKDKFAILRSRRD